jgi:hypothetical protein
MNTTTVNLLGGKLFEFIPHCLGLFDNDTETLKIAAYGGYAHQALVLSQMIGTINEAEDSSRGFNARIFETKAEYSSINGISAEINFKLQEKFTLKPPEQELMSLIDGEFVDFPVYHLLFNNLLKKRSLTISVNTQNGRQKINLIDVQICKKDIGQIEIKSLINKQRNTNQTGGYKDKTYDKLVSALYRSGYLLPTDWAKIGHKLASYDDIIIGLDTNILNDAFITNNLLPILAVIEKDKFVQTPNWILMVIPQMVVYELERASNSKGDYGKFSDAGRKGFRALQEILELRSNFDHKGISVINTGHSDESFDADALFDINNCVQSMNNNLLSLVSQQSRHHQSDHRGSKTPKSNSGDMLIRKQFKNFVDGLNFKKGAYFLTSDKVNAAMHTAQGNQALYISKPHKIEKTEICSPELLPGIKRSIPLGKLLYELLVDFGELHIQIDNETTILLECDSLGKSLEPWTSKAIRIPKKCDLEKLIKSYNGKLNLVEIQKTYKEISAQMEKNEWSVNQE